MGTATVFFIYISLLGLMWVVERIGRSMIQRPAEKAGINYAVDSSGAQRRTDCNC